ncbi:MAG: ECF transporter S component [Clostridia bacterium]|nr:ECF transporter S component [Clostridia bacterium]
MLENVMKRQNEALKAKIGYKTVVSAALIALAVALPQLVHAALGQSGGVQFLPMYLPVLLGGCLLGWKWALTVGILSPLVSFALTTLAGNPMPAAARLPFMMFELAVFALVSGLFSGLIYKNGLWAFPAVIAAQITGRAAFLGAIAIFQRVAPFTPKMIWGQIVSGIPGLLIQAVAVPLIVIALRAVLLRKK